MCYTSLMRLTLEEQEIICRAFRDIYGEQAHLWLFGSRVDDTRRGGDIDLYIETPEADVSTVVRLKSKFLDALEDELGERRIDVVVNYGNKKGDGTELLIHRIARKTGIQMV
ncbi:MAG: nucleotidyltransferase domain-containing protein [Alphaproteobacteria bacterium]